MTAFQFPRVQDVVEAPDGLTCEIHAGEGACGQPATTLHVVEQTGDRPPTTIATCNAHTPVDAAEYDDSGTGRWRLRSHPEIARTQAWYRLAPLERHCLVAIGLIETRTPVREGEIGRHLLRWYTDNTPSNKEFSDALAHLREADIIEQTTHDGETAYVVSEHGRELLAVGAAHLGTAAERPTKPGPQ
jgi:hypothetical protein